MMPGSVHIEAIDAAMAASTALPPLAAAAAPASADNWELDATVTRAMEREG
jgi:predicted Zn-dependent protease